MNMQQKIMDAIKAVVQPKGYDWVSKPNYSNTGSVYIQKTGSFTSVLAFAYDFQQGYCTLNVFNGGAKVVGGMVDNLSGHLKTFFFSYNESGKIADMLDFFNLHLPKIRAKKVKAKGKDDIATPLKALLKSHMASAGTDMSGAIRDCMTQCIKFCGDEQIDAGMLFRDAMEVFDEEASIA